MMTFIATSCVKSAPFVSRAQPGRTRPSVGNERQCTKDWISRHEIAMMEAEKDLLCCAMGGQPHHRKLPGTENCMDDGS